MANNFYYQPPIDYDLITGTSTLVVSLNEVKTNLRIDLSNTSEDTLITNLILAATNYFELKTGRDLINKTYATYLDNFPGNSSGYAPLMYGNNYNCAIKLKKSRVQSITSIKYLVDDIEVTYASSNYYFTKEADNFPQIFLKQDSSWPSDLDNKAQAVTITFVAGFGTSGSNVPYSIQQAILQLVTYLYENRGDCSCSCETAPFWIQSSIMTWKIIDL